MLQNRFHHISYYFERGASGLVWLVSDFFESEEQKFKKLGRHWGSNSWLSVFETIVRYEDNIDFFDQFQKMLSNPVILESCNFLIKRGQSIFSHSKNVLKRIEKLSQRILSNREKKVEKFWLWINLNIMLIKFISLAVETGT